MTLLPTRRATLTAGMGALAAPRIARAQDYPTRTVTIIVPYPPGGQPDVMARFLADRLNRLYPGRFVVENRVGGAGNVGTSHVARSVPDGTTIMVGTVASHGVNPGLFGASLPYDPIADFRHVALLATAPGVLVVHPALPARNFAEFVALIRANPGRYDYGTTGGGGTLQMAAILFVRATGAQLNEIPYRGGAPATLDLAAGRIALQFDTGVTGFQTARGGQARAFAVTTPQRSPFAPDVPTWREIGVDAEFTVWQGVFTATGTPAPVRQALHAAIGRALRSEATQRRFAELGADRVFGGAIEDAERVVREEFTRWEGLLANR